MNEDGWFINLTRVIAIELTRNGRRFLKALLLIQRESLRRPAENRGVKRPDFPTREKFRRKMGNLFR